MLRLWKFNVKIGSFRHLTRFLPLFPPLCIDLFIETKPNKSNLHCKHRHQPNAAIPISSTRPWLIPFGGHFSQLVTRAPNIINFPRRTFPAEIRSQAHSWKLIILLPKSHTNTQWSPILLPTVVVIVVLIELFPFNTAQESSLALPFRLKVVQCQMSLKCQNKSRTKFARLTQKRTSHFYHFKSLFQKSFSRN